MASFDLPQLDSAIMTFSSFDTKYAIFVLTLDSLCKKIISGLII